jgi:hypothetical protein
MILSIIIGLALILGTGVVCTYLEIARSIEDDAR